jgi:hypothetical protein
MGRGHAKHPFDSEEQHARLVDERNGRDERPRCQPFANFRDGDGRLQREATHLAGGSVANDVGLICEIRFWCEKMCHA